MKGQEATWVEQARASVERGTAIGASQPTSPAVRRALLVLTGCLALQSIGVSVLVPAFARKIRTLGHGVEVFGISATAFSLAALVAAPVMGMLADRFGRRRLLLGSLTVHSLVCLGDLLAPTGATFIAVRALAGGLTAGLVPATMSIVGDLSPPGERGRWIGFVTGWSGIGFVLGPPLGGWIYDRWGVAAPFLAGTIAHALAFLIAVWLIPDPGLGAVPTPESVPGTVKKRAGMLARLSSTWIAIPRPYRTWVALALISFVAVFAWRFVEPQFHFYLYDVLGWTGAQFGLAMAAYGALLVLAQTTLATLSDRLGRGPLLVIGLVIHTAQYAALIATDSFLWIGLGIALSGLGEGLFMPALNAFFLDITPKPYRARAIGFKESVFALGGLAGPVLVIWAVRYLQPVGVFAIAGALILLSAFLVPLASPRAGTGQATKAQLGRTLRGG